MAAPARVYEATAQAGMNDSQAALKTAFVRPVHASRAADECRCAFACEEVCTTAGSLPEMVAVDSSTEGSDSGSNDDDVGDVAVWPDTDSDNEGFSGPSHSRSSGRRMSVSLTFILAGTCELPTPEAAASPTGFQGGAWSQPPGSQLLQCGAPMLQMPYAFPAHGAWNQWQPAPALAPAPPAELAPTSVSPSHAAVAVASSGTAIPKGMLKSRRPRAVPMTAPVRSATALNPFFAVKAKVITETPVQQPEVQEITTVMIRNLPRRLSKERFVSDLEECGFIGKFDFVYLPRDFASGRLKGYAFVNFGSSADAEALTTTWHRTRRFDLGASDKAITVSPAHIQGYERNLKLASSAARDVHNPDFRRFVLERTDAPKSPCVDSSLQN